MLDITAVASSLIVLSVAVILLNTLCIYIIKSSSRLNKKPSSFLIVNLLSVHLLQGIFVLPLYAGKKFGYKVQSFMWAKIFANGFRFTYMLSFYGACLGVLSIALDRFLATYLMNYYKLQVTIKRVMTYLMILWIYIIGLCILPFFDLEASFNRNSTIGAVNQSVSSKLKFYYYNFPPGWVVFMLIFNAAIPYFIIIACYIYIMIRLKKLESFKTAARHRADSSIELLDLKGRIYKLRRDTLAKYKEVSYLTLVLSITYGICWTPSIINYVLLTLCESCFPVNYDDSKVEKFVGYIIKYLAFLNALASPLIYCFYHSEFRRSLSRIKSSILRKALPQEPVNDPDFLQL